MAQSKLTYNPYHLNSYANSGGYQPEEEFQELMPDPQMYVAGDFLDASNMFTVGKAPMGYSRELRKQLKKKAQMELINQVHRTQHYSIQPTKRMNKHGEVVNVKTKRKPLALGVMGAKAHLDRNT